MNACGIVVEYNPFHNGHKYHVSKSREQSGADCMIAVMSGHFLQRGEPAIIDKWHRAKAALQSGVDLVLELPYVYAVQHSDYFSKGAVLSLSALGIDSLCFGSENGKIPPFMKAYDDLKENKTSYEVKMRQALDLGHSYPDAARIANEAIGISTSSFDFSAPNNILGFSYIKQLLTYDESIKPLTIKRQESEFHDEHLSGRMASATSIRKEILKEGRISEHARQALPQETIDQLTLYRERADLWHDWNLYFPLLHYKLSVSSLKELHAIHGVDEGLEYRLKKAIKTSVSFGDFMEKVKTKRYTWTRIQRVCTHILTNFSKEEADLYLDQNTVPYVRVLGMNQTGQEYLGHRKKKMEVPLITQPQKANHLMLEIEERASAAYYNPLPNDRRNNHYHREFGAPVRI
ncbi:nucleotidyltransferase [Halobacillus sp. A1]|uniref:nucleotidyltransferase n=1 Tax=Halobacillus sp. A1 TaxID=2880262 RepID=UPI0020A6C631|nr:nucleotidyltransferase [Halobacillus sp. A1]MCP3031087.1 nucleotidyltransferase [Halobacillus sp. A1]